MQIIKTKLKLSKLRSVVLKEIVKTCKNNIDKKNLAKLKLSSFLSPHTKLSKKRCLLS